MRVPMSHGQGAAADRNVSPQGDALAVEGTGFYAELYAALEHAMLVPLVQGPEHLGDGNDAGGCGDLGAEEEALFGEAFAATSAKTGEQVTSRLSPSLGRPQTPSTLLWGGTVGVQAVACAAAP